MNLHSNAGDQLSRQRSLHNDYVILASIILGYTVIFTLLYYIRYLDFFTSNWDLGIELQMLYSTGHGMILYEAGDFQTYGVLSQLEIHSTYIAVPIAYFFQLIHNVLFLYILQALVISIAIIPLRLIGISAGLSRRSLYFLIAVYLLNFPLIASSFYDFHWMSLFPLYVFSLFLAVQKRKTAYAILITLLGTITLEVFPFLVLGVLLYFFLQKSGLSFRRILFNALDRDSALFYVVGVAGIIAYVVVRLLQTHVIPGYLDNNSGIANVEQYFIQPLYPTAFSAVGTGDSLFYWLLLYSSFAFIPFLYPKHLILNIPWLYETIVLMPRYAGIGDQYNFIALPALVIGLAFGLKRIEDRNFSRRVLLLPFMLIIIAFTMFGINGFTIRDTDMTRVIFMIIFAAVVFFLSLLFYRFGKRERAGIARKEQKGKSIRVAFAVLLAFILAFNIAAGPLNTLNNNNRVDSGYAFSYSINPEYAPLISMVALIPANSTVTASDNLFPYIAGNNNALSFYWENISKLEFKPFITYKNGTDSRYILVDQSQYFLIPAAVLSQLQNSSLYGLYAVLTTNISYPGTVYLYERSYRGTEHVFRTS